MKISDLTYLEIKELIEQAYTLVLPTGCTEQQGPHLTVDFDVWFAQELMEEVSEQAFKKHGLKIVVAPTLPFGTAFEHVNYGYGYVDLPQNVFEDVLYHSLKSFALQGFKKLVIWRGCGGHNVQNLIQRFNMDFSTIAHVETLEHPFYDVWCSIMSPEINGGHADSFTTSITMFKHPEKVRTNLIENPFNEEPDWGSESLDFSKYSKSGVIGDPTHSSAELGSRLWHATVDQVVESFKVTLNK